VTLTFNPLRQLAHETFDRIIASGEAVVGNQILVKALSRHPPNNPCSVNAANGAQWLVRPALDPGHNGWFESSSFSEPAGGMAGFESATGKNRATVSR
jgi:hypothetical protein